MGAWEEEYVEMGGSVKGWQSGDEGLLMTGADGRAARLRPGSSRAGGRRKRGGSGGSIEGWR